MYFGIKKAVHHDNRDPDLRAMIITGTGDVFSAGGDMGGRTGPGDEPVPDILPFLTIRDSRAAVVAAVNGICQAGGLLVPMLNDRYGLVDWQPCSTHWPSRPRPRR